MIALLDINPIPLSFSRLQQHGPDLRTNNENNAIVKHRNNTDHAISIMFSTLFHIGNVNQRKLV